MNMDEINVFSRKENELEALIETIRIYIWDVEMEFWMGNCSMGVMKSGERETMKKIELRNQERILTLAEKMNFKFVGILKADTIKQTMMIEK